jgi:ankyrin repeat protein
METLERRSFMLSSTGSKVVSWLLTNGANINHQDRNGWSALHFAVQERNSEVAEYLLHHGASVHLQDSYGNTPLWRAAFDARGSYGLVRLLLSHKADPNLKNKVNRSPMDFAVQIGDDALVTILKNGL